MQSKLRQNGEPWEISKGFDSSAVIGNFVEIEKLGDTCQLPFSLSINGNTVQQGNSKDMIFNIDDIIAYVSRFYTLKIGDLIYTGTPDGIGPVKINDHLQGYLKEEKVLDFYVK